MKTIYKSLALLFVFSMGMSSAFADHHKSLWNDYKGKAGPECEGDPQELFGAFAQNLFPGPRAFVQFDALGPVTLGPAFHPDEG